VGIADEVVRAAGLTTCWSGLGATVGDAVVRIADEVARAAGVTVVLALVFFASTTTATVNPAITIIAIASSALRCW
jgi:glycerol uptake facilitator-like aquaporin